MIILPLFALAAAQATSPASKVLAVCGASTGKSFYVEPKVTGWIDDGVTGGSVTLFLDNNGNPDIIIRDAMKLSRFSSATGKVVAPLIAEDKGSFIFIVLDGELNEVTTYQVVTAPSGERSLLWTGTKARKTKAGITKVSAYVAPCEAARH